jgi:uncharacterized protein with HEPN domain
MPRHDADVRLRHMLDAAREAAHMAQGKTRADLDADRPRNLSLVRLLEIVGEAASRVPADARGEYPGIPWTQIAGLRNRLIHGYDNVDFDILWQIIIQDLPPLIAKLEKILSSGPRPQENSAKRDS